MDSFPKGRDVDGAVQFNEKGNFTSARSRQLIQDHRGFCFVLIIFSSRCRFRLAREPAPFEA